MTLNGVIPNSIALQAAFVTVVEDRPMMSAKYRLPVIFGQNWPTQQSHGLFATVKLLVLATRECGMYHDAFGHICPSVCNSVTLEPWPSEFIFGMHVHLRNLQIMFLYQGHRVKVKVTGTRNMSMCFARTLCFGISCFMSRLVLISVVSLAVYVNDMLYTLPHSKLVFSMRLRILKVLLCYSAR